MSTCPACNAPLVATTPFCPSCGMRLGNSVRTQPGSTPSVTAYVPLAGMIDGAEATRGLAPATLLRGQYRIERLLGAGAFGRVYLATDVQSPGNASVAIKELMIQQFADPEEQHETLSWFKREVSTLLRLDHPSIPAIHGYWTDHGGTTGSCYLVMEYVPGKTLEQVLIASGGPLPWQQVVEWGVVLCEVLHYLHTCTPPFVFRDVKLQNIMLDSRSNRPVLIDFGITRQLSQAGGTAIGTWGYVPMEQVLGNAEPRSDLYALGATLHALLSGRNPETEYQRRQRTGMDLAHTMRALFPPLDTLALAAPPALAHVISAATAFSIEERFPDAQALAAALRALQGQPPQTVLLAGHAQRETSPEGVPDEAERTQNELVVCARGTGHFTSIGEAMHHLPSGGRITVRPGVYQEHLLVEKPLTIEGMGNVQDVVVQASDAACLTIRSTGVTIRRLTLQNTDWRGHIYHAVHVAGGEPLLEDCRMTAASAACVGIYGLNTNPTIRQCSIEDGGSSGITVFSGARALIEQCAISGHQTAALEIHGAGDPVIHGCRISHGAEHGVLVHMAGKGLLEECEIRDSGIGVALRGNSTAVLRRCAILGAHTHGLICTRSRSEVEGCEIGHSGKDGVLLEEADDSALHSCHIHHNQGSGILVHPKSTTRIVGGEVTENAGAGLTIDRDANPTIQVCRIQRNAHFAITVHDGGRATVTDCDLTANAAGAWNMGILTRFGVQRQGNKQ